MVRSTKGTRAPGWIADYLRDWWPLAEKTGTGRRGTDILNTPGVVWEVKTAAEFKPTGFIGQAQRHAGSSGALAIAVYVPNGIGRESIGASLAIVPLAVMMQLLEQTEYAPAKVTP